MTITPDINGWTGRDGKVRRYINNWVALIGLELDHYKTGNIAGAWLDDVKVSNRQAGLLAAGKVWLDEDDTLHMDYHQASNLMDLDEKRARILAALAPEPEPEAAKEETTDTPDAAPAPTAEPIVMPAEIAEQMLARAKALKADEIRRFVEEVWIASTEGERRLGMGTPWDIAWAGADAALWGREIPAARSLQQDFAMAAARESSLTTEEVWQAAHAMQVTIAAVFTRRFIGPARYDILTGPWRSVVGELPDYTNYDWLKKSAALQKPAA